MPALLMGYLGLIALVIFIDMFVRGLRRYIIRRFDFEDRPYWVDQIIDAVEGR